MEGITDPQIRFSIETANIKDPAILARHLRTMQFNMGQKLSVPNITNTQSRNLPFTRSEHANDVFIADGRITFERIVLNDTDPSLR